MFTNKIISEAYKKVVESQNKIVNEWCDTEDDPDRVYVVKAGDTLSEIAEKHGTSVKELMKINNIKDPNKIKIGQRINLF